MKDYHTRNRQPLPKEQLLYIMFGLTFGVSGIFFMKNLLTSSVQGMVAIGGCLLVLTIVTVLMYRMGASLYWKQFIVSNCLVGLIFVVSLNSGAYYSDDFPLFLIAVGLGSLYLEPRITVVQTILSTLALIALYLINPDKADPLGQYIMCVVMMVLAALTFSIAIYRGRKFIQLSEDRAEEADRLLESIRRTQAELEQNYLRSSGRLDQMREANCNLEHNTRSLQRGSNGIQVGTRELEHTFSTARSGIQAASGQIAGLDEDIRRVEQAMEESNGQLNQIGQQMEQVNGAITAAQAVFVELQQQTREISRLTEQMQNIAFHTTILALNASVEAARAGEYGVGFTVVANEVQRLATESESCTGQVGVLVAKINHNIEQTAQRMEESIQVIHRSRITMGDMEGEFRNLENRFGGLHQSIAQQSNSVREMDREFARLENRIGEMNDSSHTNQQAVEAIVGAIRDYQKQMELIVADSRHLQELSTAMMDNAT